MTSEAIAVFDDARLAVAHLRKTFDQYVEIGKAVVLARDMANRRGGTKTFMRIIQQQELGSVVTKSIASRLEKIMARIDEVTAWRATLTDQQRIDYASPTSILKRCPIFRTPPAPNDETEERMTPAERDRQQLATAIEENHRLRTEIARREESGERWTPTDTVDGVATAIVGMFSKNKAQTIARRVLAILRERAAHDGPGER